jgi:hypothetical protein
VLRGELASAGAAADVGVAAALWVVATAGAAAVVPAVAVAVVVAGVPAVAAAGQAVAAVLASAVAAVVSDGGLVVGAAAAAVLQLLLFLPLLWLRQRLRLWWLLLQCLLQVWLSLLFVRKHCIKIVHNNTYIIIYMYHACLGMLAMSSWTGFQARIRVPTDEHGLL